MIKKEGNIALIIVIIIALVIIGFSVYNSTQKEEEVSETIEEKVEWEPEGEAEEKTEEAAVAEEVPKEIVVSISRFKFDKPEIIIEPGTKVIWNNTDTRKHMITNKYLGLFRNMRKSLGYGDTFEYTFNEPGVYYILEANFGINGKIIVGKNVVNADVIVKKKNESGIQSIIGNIVKDLQRGKTNSLTILFTVLLFTTIVFFIGFYKHRDKKSVHG
ncbi:MAG: hypothetical protein KAU20_02910 [Nanoarchaeota archaeon]|nr:hypothetical protein [Nanoarchaeota archaeon]